MAEFKKDYLDIPFEIKSVDTETGIFSGYASTFGGKPDSYNDIIAEGAFGKSLSKNGANGLGVALLWQHQSDNPIGVWKSLAEDSKGLKVEGKLTTGVRQADEALLLMKDGAIGAMSIGFTPKKWEYDKDNKIRTLTEIDLWEISLVTFPANPRAKVTGIKNIESAKNERELEHALCEAGLSRKQALVVVSRCKHSLRESRCGWKDVVSALKEVNAGKN